MSNVTLEPTDGSKCIDGGDSLAGEQYCLDKSTVARADVEEVSKEALLESGYLNRTSLGNLTAVSVSVGAPLDVIEFYQMMAEFSAYVCADSVTGQTTDDMEAALDDTLPRLWDLHFMAHRSTPLPDSGLATGFLSSS